jgi:hypothetical protein
MRKIVFSSLECERVIKIGFPREIWGTYVVY